MIVFALWWEVTTSLNLQWREMQILACVRVRVRVRVCVRVCAYACACVRMCTDARIFGCVL